MLFATVIIPMEEMPLDITDLICYEPWCEIEDMIDTKWYPTRVCSTCKQFVPIVEPQNTPVEYTHPQ